jgi:hypothetical protein
MMEYVSCDVSVIGMGCVAGPPAMILAAGAKGKRLAYPSARIILSQPLGGLSGTSYEVRIQAKELSRNARSQVAFFSKFTGVPFEEIGEYLVRDSYMSPGGGHEAQHHRWHARGERGEAQEGALNARRMFSRKFDRSRRKRDARFARFRAHSFKSTETIVHYRHERRAIVVHTTYVSRWRSQRRSARVNVAPY